VPEAPDILIAGAGPGGLAAALSLHALGLPVRVFESVPELKPLGVGINLLPHAVRELDELGLREQLEAAGVPCRELAYHTKRGERIWGEPRGLQAGYRWPQISIHRGVLQQLLFDTARQRLGEDRIQLGRHLVSLSAATGRGVRVSLEDRTASGAGRRHEAEGRLLIAADGIHSVVRQHVHPGEGPPLWNGAVMWRGVAEAEPFLDGRTMVMAGHTRQKFVAYPISDRGELPGHQLINFVAELRFDERELSEREDWNKPGRLQDFLPAFERWDFGFLNARTLIERAERTWVYPMVDRDPLPRWSHGPVTLLGDAAHPMYPIGSNGASQAILDARVLAGCLRHHDDPERALERYEQVRREPTAAIVLANRGQGPEAAMQLVEDRAPDGFSHLHDVVSEQELAVIADKYKRLAGFAIAELNARPSLIDPAAWSR
jgi:2-polyprenyl-6-methoxyphenol hydroxylase-like FAD-dependent oxidoreductase